MRDALLALILAPFWLLMAPLTAFIAGSVWLAFRFCPVTELRDPVQD